MMNARVADWLEKKERRKETEVIWLVIWIRDGDEASSTNKQLHTEQLKKKPRFI